jgi:NAD(P)-dependent dehydrogenase (short-subunit alcohol dehydrogenase family)
MEAKTFPRMCSRENDSAQIPVRRRQPEEIARCVVFLASDDAGSTLSANGGQYLA